MSTHHYRECLFHPHLFLYLKLDTYNLAYHRRPYSRKNQNPPTLLGCHLVLLNALLPPLAHLFLSLHLGQGCFLVLLLHVALEPQLAIAKASSAVFAEEITFASFFVVAIVLKPF